jgi:DNA-binding CsgD family transcriptional regulator
MIYATPTQLMVHQRLMRRLPVRAVVCADEPEDVPESAPPPPEARADPKKDELERAELWKLPSGLNFIQKAEIREHRMLSLMCRGMYYSGRHLAALANMNEKTFYTHVKRMVQRGQLVRSGSRHHFLYRKA